MLLNDVIMYSDKKMRWILCEYGDWLCLLNAKRSATRRSHSGIGFSILKQKQRPQFHYSNKTWAVNGQSQNMISVFPVGQQYSTLIAAYNLTSTIITIIASVQGNVAKGSIITAHPPLQSSRFTLHILLRLAAVNALVCHYVGRQKKCAMRLSLSSIHPHKSPQNDTLMGWPSVHRLSMCPRCRQTDHAMCDCVAKALSMHWVQAMTPNKNNRFNVK